MNWSDHVAAFVIPELMACVIALFLLCAYRLLADDSTKNTHRGLTLWAAFSVALLTADAMTYLFPATQLDALASVATAAVSCTVFLLFACYLNFLNAWTEGGSKAFRLLRLSGFVLVGAVVAFSAVDCLVSKDLSHLQWYDLYVAAMVALCALCAVATLVQRKSLQPHELLVALSFPIIAAVLYAVPTYGFMLVLIWNVLVQLLIYLLVVQRERNERQAKLLQLEATEKELILKRQALVQSQMRPHFIFNVLTIIHILCAKDPARAQEALGHFSRFLRSNLNKMDRNELIPFQEELNFIEEYVYLEKMRFGDKLAVEYQLETTAFSIPALSVQPLVENAIRHGIRQKKNGGTVVVATKDCVSHIEIYVKDDGAGFDMEADKADNDVHLGISSVKTRIQELAGGTVSVESVVGEGTRATIAIPK